MTRLEKLPFWPARMTAPVAAAYMGVSHTTFLERFGDKGVREGGNVFWAKIQLDRIIEEQFGIELSSQSAAATKPVVSDYDLWKSGQ